MNVPYGHRRRCPRTPPDKAPVVDLGRGRGAGPGAFGQLRRDVRIRASSDADSHPARSPAPSPGAVRSAALRSVRPPRLLPRSVAVDARRAPTAVRGRHGDAPSGVAEGVRHNGSMRAGAGVPERHHLGGASATLSTARACRRVVMSCASRWTTPGPVRGLSDAQLEPDEGPRMMRRQRPRSQEISPAGAGPGLSGDVGCGRVGGGALGGGVGGRGWSPPPTAFAATSDTGAPGAGSAWRRWGR